LKKELGGQRSPSSRAERAEEWGEGGWGDRGPPFVCLGRLDFLALRGVLPSEASPSFPLHFVEREGPEINVIQIRQDRLRYVPPLHEVERGPGGEDSEGRTLRKAEMPWS
jgi:hypothetical protein